LFPGEEVHLPRTPHLQVQDTIGDARNAFLGVITTYHPRAPAVSSPKLVGALSSSLAKLVDKDAHDHDRTVGTASVHRVHSSATTCIHWRGRVGGRDG